VEAMKKRILYTIPNVDTAGSGKALQYIARSAKSAGWEVHIAMQHTRGVLAEELLREFYVHEMDYITPMRPLTRLFYGAWGVSRKFRKIAPNLIHSFNYMAEYSEALAAQMAGIPWLFTKKNMSWKGMAYNQWRLRSLFAKVIIVQNTDMEKDFYPNSKKIFCIPRGVYFDHFAVSKNIQNQIDRKNHNPHTRIIITVANLVPVKGIEDLILAFVSLKEIYSDWELWIVGDHELDPAYTLKLNRLVEDAKINDAVWFAGKQHDIRPFLGAAEIFVLPTRDEGRREGSPVATLEAMAAGLVVLGSNVPGIRDQFQYFPEYLFAPGNSISLIEKLTPLLNNTTKKNVAIGKRFQSVAKNHFSLEMEVKKHLSVYESCCQ
jgi:glycosyltransferase involved in cell wall biosynthesis